MTDTDTTKPSPDAWVEIVITSPHELAEALSSFMTDHGADGVFEEDDVDPNEIDEVRPRELEEIKAYLPAASDWKSCINDLQHYIEDLAAIFPEYKRPDYVVRSINDPDWGEQWKKYFKPIRIQKNIVIKPTWERFTPSARDIVIDIDPGMAFGTGQHATTRMCLEALEALLLKDHAIKNWKILDVGTGTGILAIACAKLGAEKIVAVDIDPQATEIAHKNVSLNHVGDQVEVVNRNIAEFKGHFELIVANLTAEPLIELRSHILSLLTPGAYLIVSGIIEQSLPKIEANFLGEPFTVLSCQKDKEWGVLHPSEILRRPGS